MTTLESSVRGDRARSVDERRPLGSIRFDWVAAILGLWLMFGTYLDGWHRPDALLRGAALLPAVIGMTLIVQPLSFMVQFGHPSLFPWAALMADSGSTSFPQALGIAMIIVHTGILMSVVLYGVRRWALPPGSVTLIFTVNAVALTAMKYDERFGPFLAIAQVLAGVNADALIPKVPSIRFHKKYEKFKPKRLCQNF